MYRTLETSFWTDEKVAELDSKSRLVMLYLITSPHSHFSGIYYLPIGAAVDELGMPRGQIESILDTLSGHGDRVSGLGMACRDKKNSLIWVVNMLEYQGAGPKVYAGAAKHLLSLHNSPLIELFLQRYPVVQQHYKPARPQMPKPTRKSIPCALRFKVLERDLHTCQYCGAKAPDVALEVDHVVPVSAGGTNELSNLRASCVACNLGKWDRVSENGDRVSGLGVQEQEQEQKQEQEQENPPTPQGGRGGPEPDELAHYPTLQTDAFRKAWADWQQHRSEIRHSLKPTTVSRQLAKLAKAGPAQAVAMIEQSISQGWQGLFELRNGRAESKATLPSGFTIKPSIRVGQ